MDILYWILIGIFVLALLYGVLNWLGVFMWSWEENGKGFTIKLIILFILFIVPSQVKEYAPEYYGFAIWALILYCVALLIHKLWTKGLDKVD